MHRWTSKPVSSDELSAHASEIDVLDVAVAVRLPGAAGGEGGGGATAPTAPKTSAEKDPEPEKDSTRSCHVPAAALATPRVSKRPGAAQLPFVASSMHRLIATTVPVGATR